MSWARGDKIAFVGVAVACIAIFTALFQKEIRIWVGVDSQFFTSTLPIGISQSQVEKNFAEHLSATVNLEMVAIPGGEFETKPREVIHSYKVTLKPFFMSKFEVTQAQWTAVMGRGWFGLSDNNPSYFKGDNLPVETVSWYKAKEFCEKLSRMTGKEYRLPSAAEWEYAARAGSTGAYCFGNDAVLLGQYAWYDENSFGQTHPVGQKKPNAWGLYDMHGNVWEWCLDSMDGVSSWITDENKSVRARTLQGGSWRSNRGLARFAVPYNWHPSETYYHFGFRVVVSTGT